MKRKNYTFLRQDWLTERLYMNEQEIKVYKDAYADASYAKIGFKGKIANEKGVIYCPYKKPSKFRQFINWIANKFVIFKSKCQAEELIEGNKNMVEELSKEIAELKRIKGCLEFDLTCGGIINFGPIMRELDKVNDKLKKLEKQYENEEKSKCP